MPCKAPLAARETFSAFLIFKQILNMILTNLTFPMANDLILKYFTYQGFSSLTELPDLAFKVKTYLIVNSNAAMNLI